MLYPETPFRLSPPSLDWELMDNAQLRVLLKNKDYSSDQRLEMIAVLIDRNCKSINDLEDNS